MSLDALFILSFSGEIIVQKNYKKESKTLICQDFFREYVTNKQRFETDFPIIRLKDHFCPFVVSSDILLVAIVSEDVQILAVYHILYNLLENLKSSFKGALSAERIRNNFTSILNLLEHYLDYGFPLISHKFVLESMVKPQGVMDKIEETIVGRSGQSKDTSQYLEKYVENISDIKDYSVWRIPDIKSSEEIFFDVIEYYDCVIDKNGQFLIQDVNGEIKADCNLSGVPNVNLYLSTGVDFYDYSVHECLFESVEAFEREKVLNFVPPTGPFTLFYYCLKNINVKLPFETIQSVKFVENSVAINVKIESRLVSGVSFLTEDFHVKLLLPNGLIQKDITYTGGNVQMNDNITNLLWKIGELKKDSSFSLKANFEVKEGFNVSSKNFVMCLKYQIPLYSYSGTKIDKAVVRDGAPNLSKKARNISKSGYFEIRMN